MRVKVSLKSIQTTTIIILTFFLQANYADDIYSRITTYFISCDSVLAATAKKVSNITKLDPTDQLLLEKTGVYPEFEYLMRVNSKGKIISKVVDDKALSRTYRYVGKQMWYKTVALNKRPYYGSIVNRKGYYLFWVKPLLVWTKYGSRLGGALVAKININKCFENIVEESEMTFQVAYRGKNVFSNFEKGDLGKHTEKKLAVYGMQGLTLKYKETAVRKRPVAAAGQQALKAKDTKAVAAKGKAQKPAKTVTPRKAKADAEKTTAKAQEKKAAIGKVPGSKEEKDKKSGAISVATAIAFILACIILVALSFIVLKRAADKNRKIIESIDKGEL